MSVRTTSFLEELKAAQEITPDDWKLSFMYIDDEYKAVLRRIPQLIEVVEILEAYASLGRDGAVLDNKHTQRQHFAVDLLSKLEGGKENG